MDAVALLREQATAVNDQMGLIVKDVTAEQAVWRMDGSMANPIGLTLLHAYLTEDRNVSRFAGRPTCYESGGWVERLGTDAAAVWSVAPQVDPDALRAYAAEVRAATVAYLESITPDTLDQMVEGPRGPRSLGSMLTLACVTHKSTHAGEIAALLGCQGVKGLPV